MFLGHINYSSDMLTIHLDIVEFLPECEMTIKQFDMYESVHVTDILNNHIVMFHACFMFHTS